ncbi:uroporphyrinogen-III synthase [Paenibacillus chartarius]|uniref:Uroporphyrinogen-III synthase n=1 Tax=Paenibacillus chartarius TaxID=747481 RepID=A0ABV6DSU2_9BACL
MRRLEGKRIALTGPRRSEELGTLIAKMGGVPLFRPAQGTTVLDDSNIEAEVKRVAEGAFDWMILTTGVGTELLYETAKRLDMAEQFVSSLGGMQIAARGYKTVNMLKKLGLKPVVRDDDGSTAGLLRQMAAFDLSGAKVALQLHGDPAPKLVQWLEAQGAQYREILPYSHTPPEPEVMDRLLEEIVRGDADAVAFTSTPQSRFLMSHARARGMEQDVIKAFTDRVVAVAVGKVTAQALREEGISRVVVPSEERMGSAIVALSDYYAGSSTVE